MRLKALVVHQPWAWAILAGHKRVENRSWRTPYRGPVAIVAGASRKSLPGGLAFLRGLGIEPPADLPFGCILGVVTLARITAAGDAADPFASGPWCWHLADPTPLAKPVPFRGRLSLFDLPAGVLG